MHFTVLSAMCYCALRSIAAPIMILRKLHVNSPQPVWRAVLKLLMVWHLAASLSVWVPQKSQMATSAVQTLVTDKWTLFMQFLFLLAVIIYSYSIHSYKWVWWGKKTERCHHPQLTNWLLVQPSDDPTAMFLSSLTMGIKTKLKLIEITESSHFAHLSQQTHSSSAFEEVHCGKCIYIKAS